MSLESLDVTPSRSDVLVNATGDETVTGGQTAVYKIKPGQYYLHGRMPTGWSVTFTPIADLTRHACAPRAPDVT
jgi:hypothetical protein